MSGASPDQVAANVFWSVIVCAGGFALTVYLVIY